jgi:hypothetical protein
MGEDQLPSARWYVAIRGEAYGPADKATLVQWAAEGRLTAGTDVCPEGEQAWRPLNSVAELRDLPLAAPPAPSQPAYYPTVHVPPQNRLGSCPTCTGPVSNVAPAYGWPWGLFQRSLRPEFRCAQCGRPMPFEELPPGAQDKVARDVRRGTIWWFVIVVGLILFIAACFFGSVASVQ